MRFSEGTGARSASSREGGAHAERAVGLQVFQLSRPTPRRSPVVRQVRQLLVFFRSDPHELTLVEDPKSSVLDFEDSPPLQVGQNSIDMNSCQAKTVGNVCLRGRKLERAAPHEPPVPYAGTQFDKKLCDCAYCIATTHRGGSVVHRLKIIGNPKVRFLPLLLSVLRETPHVFDGEPAHGDFR